MQPEVRRNRDGPLFHRWYEYAAGRYGGPDPWGRLGDPHPYNYARSNPLTFADFLGQKSRTCCTPISQTLVLRREKHCFIEVVNPDSGKKTTYSLHGMGNPRRDWGGPIGCTFVNDHFDSTASGRPGYGCGKWSEDCAPDECVKQQHRNYPSATRYKLLGPNSNTFAGSVTKACGLDPPSSVGGLRTPGWNKPLPSQIFLPSLRGPLTSLGSFCPGRR